MAVKFMEKSKGVMLILETFWKGRTKAWRELAVGFWDRERGVYFFLDGDLVDTCASDDEVRVWLGNMVPDTHLDGFVGVRKLVEVLIRRPRCSG
jgi:hypothetical protein